MLILRFLKFPKSVEARGKGGRSFPLDEGAVSAALQVESSSTTGYPHLQKCEYRYSVGKRSWYSENSENATMQCY